MHHQLVSGEREKINNKINRVLAIRRVGGGLEKFSLISQIECVYGLVVHVKPSRWTFGESCRDDERRYQNSSSLH